MPEHVAEIRFLIRYKDEKIESIFREMPERSRDGARIELVVRIADTDGAILRQAKEACARRDALCRYPGCDRPDLDYRTRMRRWRMFRRRKKLEKECRNEDARLRGIVLGKLEYAIFHGSDVAQEPQGLAPFRLVRLAELPDLLKAAQRAYGLAVLILESDGLLADSSTLVAWAA